MTFRFGTFDFNHKKYFANVDLFFYGNILKCLSIVSVPVTKPFEPWSVSHFRFRNRLATSFCLWLMFVQLPCSLLRRLLREHKHFIEICVRGSCSCTPLYCLQFCCSWWGMHKRWKYCFWGVTLWAVSTAYPQFWYFWNAVNLGVWLQCVLSENIHGAPALGLS